MMTSNYTLFRYAPKAPGCLPTCQHPTRQKSLHCGELTTADVAYFHGCYYANKTRPTQDTFLLKHVTSVPSMRRREKDGSRSARRMSCYYFVRTLNRKTVQVCREAFLGILHVKKDRIRNLLQKFHETGKVSNSTCWCGIESLIIRNFGRGARK